MNIVAIIPAHLSSVRFPRKILTPIGSLPMIEHVRRRALLSKCSDVYVATCDKEIADCVASFGGKVIYTSNYHPNGTSRVSEAIQQIDCSHCILVQGDEPLIIPSDIDLFIDRIVSTPNYSIWNCISPLKDESSLDHHSIVKTFLDSDSNLIHIFRRSPFYSDSLFQLKFVYKILGLIAFRKGFLEQFNDLEISLADKYESIEQLRFIYNGFKINGVLLSNCFPSINEPSDKDLVLDCLKNNLLQSQLLYEIL